MERTALIVVLEVLASLVGGVFSALAATFLIRGASVYFVVWCAIGGVFIAKLIVGAWVKAMIHAQKNPIVAALLFLVMTVLANVGLVLNFSELH